MSINSKEVRTDGLGFEVSALAWSCVACFFQAVGIVSPEAVRNGSGLGAQFSVAWPASRIYSFKMGGTGQARDLDRTDSFGG